jgi:hypothetical protein
LYLEGSSVSLESVGAWELPVALARITEDIAGERDQLVTLIEDCLERSNK